jgi:hypothetical protein
MRGAVPWVESAFVVLGGKRVFVVIREGRSCRQCGRLGVRSWVVVLGRISRCLGWVRRLESRCSWSCLLLGLGGEQGQEQVSLMLDLGIYDVLRAGQKYPR